jgi:large subunit ribosomal protein L3
MKKGLIGKKLGMTHIYDEAGAMVPVTVVELGPCPVLAVRTRDKNGYSALQLGFGKAKKKNVSKAVLGTLRPANLEDNPPQVIREIRLDNDPSDEVGSVLDASVFEPNEYVDVIGQTIGKGFAGVVKRFGYGGGRASHGGAWTRRPGSIGCCTSPGKIIKGKGMPGHMGNVRRTVQNLLVVSVRPEENLIFIKGAIPGAAGGLVIVRNAVKK